MKAKAGFRIGPGLASLLMIMVTLLIAALAILAMASATSDAALSQRSLETAQRYYRAAAQMQRELSTIDHRLLGARNEAAGSVDEYAQLIRTIKDDYLTGNGTDTDGESESVAQVLRVMIPMDNDCFIEALLMIPLKLSGPRFAITSHKLVDDAPWETSQEFNLYTH